MSFTLDWKGPEVTQQINAEAARKLDLAADQVVRAAQQNLAASGAIRSGDLYRSIRKSRVYNVGESIRIDIISDLPYSMIQEQRKAFLRNALQSITSI